MTTLRSPAIDCDVDGWTKLSHLLAMSSREKSYWRRRGFLLHIVMSVAYYCLIVMSGNFSYIVVLSVFVDACRYSILDHFYVCCLRANV